MRYQAALLLLFASFVAHAQEIKINTTGQFFGRRHFYYEHFVARGWGAEGSLALVDKVNANEIFDDPVKFVKVGGNMRKYLSRRENHDRFYMGLYLSHLRGHRYRENLVSDQISRSALGYLLGYKVKSRRQLTGEFVLGVGRLYVHGNPDPNLGAINVDWIARFSIGYRFGKDYSVKNE